MLKPAMFECKPREMIGNHLRCKGCVPAAGGAKQNWAEALQILGSMRQRGEMPEAWRFDIFRLWEPVEMIPRIPRAVLVDDLGLSHGFPGSKTKDSLSPRTGKPRNASRTC